MDTLREKLVYRRVKEEILRKITSGEWVEGRRIPSESALIKQFACSRMTVRKGLEELSRDNYLKVFHGKGRFVSRPTDVSPSRLKGAISIAVVGISPYQLESAREPTIYGLQLLNGLQQALFLHGVLPVFFETIGDAEQARRKADGTILIGARSEHLSPTRPLIRSKTPLVILNPNTPAPLIHTVEVENRHSSRRIVDYLVQLGHTRIGCITAPRSYPYAENRWLGYRDALKAAGIGSDLTLEVVPSDTGIAGHISAFMARNRPITALFMAAGRVQQPVCDYLASARMSVPQDVSLVAFDEMPLNSPCPRITCLKQPLESLAVDAVDTLIQVIREQPRKAIHINREPLFIMGDSCRRQPGGVHGKTR